MRSSISVDPESPEARRILRFSTSDEARKKVYIAQNKVVSESINVLEQLLRARANVSVLVGHRSYSEMLLLDKMGGKPGECMSYEVSATC
jgi:mitochondrial intermediate peptidase